MTDTLKLFTTSSLFDATSALLGKLNIRFNRQTAEPINVAALYDGAIPQYLTNALRLIEHTYFIGVANDLSLDTGEKSDNTIDEISEKIANGGRYDGMFIFACDAAADAHITRSDISALTRAFNRISYANPVILIIRQANLISLSTCERMTYTQEWRKNFGEKLGKVSILRNVDCENPHRGHVNIIESIGEEKFRTFDGLYSHWKEKFSNELLTKKFYSELSDWYAWAVQIAKFPNNIETKVDDQRFNHESCIRLITRLIFVWFLKQKHLIPRELFDEAYIRENFIDDFDPHSRNHLLYDSEKSKYYRLILQNLFFAMLNCPIVAEGKTTPNNRRFMMHDTYHGINKDHNINNIMRYELEFKEGGNSKFLQLANRYVPFLNGGLFDCLDNKNTGIYYDGFSENQKSLDSLFLPDYLFFGSEVGNSIDLSQWYGDAKKKKVSARGIIDILNRYSFTVEENTPLEQEVSLDPELLGKVFENLLAAYNPETQTSARKQTGSFYTPREIVQYMVDESLVAHLKRKCGDDGEQLYRSLVSYSDDEVVMDDQKRKSIVEALYDCRILDPACGSGAFPMGVLQQMVHVLKKVDPTNDLWNKKVVDIATEEARQEMLKATETKAREQIEEERKARLADIEEAFNNAINYPDYARKLFLIEHCIHGVDIQPIAIQISKLRFFISLVVDQKPTNDPKTNFGIRPLPNLESKFVSANTLIPLDRTENLFTSTDEIRAYEKQLEDLSHRIFLSKRNAEKTRLRQEMDVTRMNMAMTLNNNGFLGETGYDQLVNWNMFDQNSSATFFDPEWMFGVKDGFDIVIGNPPYVVVSKSNIYNKKFVTGECCELYAYFFEKAINVLSTSGVMSFITASLYIKGLKFNTLRSLLERQTILSNLKVVGDNVFENVQMPTAIFLAKKGQGKWKFNDMLPGGNILSKMDKLGLPLDTISNVQRGFEIGRDQVSNNGDYPFLTGSNVKKYYHESVSYISESTFRNFAKEDYYYTGERLLIRETGSSLTVLYENTKLYCNRSLYSIKIKDSRFLTKFVLGCLNSKAIQYYYSAKFKSDTELFPKIRIKQAKMLPIPLVNEHIQKIVVRLIDSIISAFSNNISYNDFENKIDHIVYHLYNLTYDEVLIIDPQTPITREEYNNFKIEA
ncbi:MAG: N-6 DNA methylase [Paludibacteraceae bacterium]|nr:N-6 DNA methylase [Paludibacteraceae bacterium]